MSCQAEHFQLEFMQFIQNKLFFKLVIIFSSVALLLIPLLALSKILSKNSEFEGNMTNRDANPPTPEVIYKTEEIEEVSYKYLETAKPTQVSTIAPSTQSPTFVPSPKYKHEEKENDD